MNSAKNVVLVIGMPIGFLQMALALSMTVVASVWLGLAKAMAARLLV